MSRPILLLAIALTLCAAPSRAGELVVDNFAENMNCCVEFEIWRMGSAEVRTLCAGPQRRERFSDAMAAIGKMKAVCRRPEDVRDDASPRSEARFVPEGIYSPLSGYRVEFSPTGSIAFSSID